MLKFWSLYSSTGDQLVEILNPGKMQVGISENKQLRTPDMVKEALKTSKKNWSVAGLRAEHAYKWD